MAQRLMIQAHGAIGDAQLKEDMAKKIYKLAQSLNDAVPSYQLAAQQAAVHVLATSFLQAQEKTQEAMAVDRLRKMQGLTREGVEGLGRAVAELSEEMTLVRKEVVGA